MEDNRTTALSLLSSLRNDLSNASATLEEHDYIYLSQSFDRLFMGYQNGTYDSAAVQAGVTEIRSALSDMRSTSTPSLAPSMGETHRDEVLARNYQALAERLLDQERGSWDSRHVEIVQGAITRLSEFDGSSYTTLAHQLQQRMSDSVWMGNIELAETVSQFEQETRNLQASLLEALQEKQQALEPETRDVISSDMTLALPEENEVKSVIRNASAQAIRSQTSSPSIKVSPDFRPHTDTHQNTEAFRHAIEGIQLAGQRVIADEYNKLVAIYKSVLAEVAKNSTPENLSATTKLTDSFLDSEAKNAQELQEKSAQIHRFLNELSLNTPTAKHALSETEAIRVRAGILSEIETSSKELSNRDLHEDARQQLDARLLFERKRMQFEQTHALTDNTAMMQALDYEVPTPSFQAAQSTMIDNIKRLRQVVQSASSGDVGLYAPQAGSEFVRNTSAAIQAADKSTPLPSRIPSIHSNTAAKVNRLMKEVRQVSYHPSVRADMGFATPHFQMDSNAVQPLFKRVRFNRNDPEAQRILPALYNVSGIQVKSGKTDKPLRKSYTNLNLEGSNAKIIDILESQFGDVNEVIGRQTDKVMGMALDASQTLVKPNSPFRKVGGAISDWIDNKRNAKFDSGSDTDLIKAGKMASSNIESTIRGEAMSIPTSVQEKLSPFLNFDISNVKIFAGPVAAMAADAMGAHAFTLGKNIFLGANKLDFNSAEGLGLLAHEILHTSHFSSGQSTEAKEQAAETLENKVKTAFGNSDKPAFAKEGDGGKRKSIPDLKKNGASLPVDSNSVGSKFSYDPDEIYEAVSERVTEMIIESMKLYAESKGSDNK